MKLDEIIAIADKAYPDGLVMEFYEALQNAKRSAAQPWLRLAKAREEGVSGDTLAEFIAIEITETYDEAASNEEQVNEALRVMCSAANELSDVCAALRVKLNHEREGEHHGQE